MIAEKQDAQDFDLILALRRVYRFARYMAHTTSSIWAVVEGSSFS